MIFVGLTQNIPQLLSASDIMLLPSLYEGFPFTTVEAQASGIRCLVADTITRQCKFLDDFYFLPLNKIKWIEKIENNSGSYNRKENGIKAKTLISDAGYDITKNVRKLENYYIKFGKKKY